MSALLIASSALLIASASSNSVHGPSCPIHSYWALWVSLSFLVSGLLCLVPAFRVSNLDASTRWMYDYVACWALALVFLITGMVIDCA